MKRKFTFLTAAFMLLAFLAVPMGMRGQSDYSAVYTSQDGLLSTAGGSNLTASTINISDTDYNCIKAGTSSKAGVWQITVPSGTKYLHLHAAAYANTTVTLSSSPTGYNVSLSAAASITGNPPFNFAQNASSTDYYKVITFTTVLDDDLTITFTASGGKRFVVWGVNAEEGGGSQLTTSDLALTGASVALTFDLYNNNSAQTISYTTSSTGTVSVDANSYVTAEVDQLNKTISVTPNAVTGTTQTITVRQDADGTYDAGTATFTVDITDSTPAADVTFTAGTDLGSTGSNNSPDSMTKDGVTVSSTDAAFTTAQYRLYQNSETTISAPGYTITSIVFTGVDTSKPVSGLSVTGNNGTYSVNNNVGTWTGSASSVVFSASAQVRVGTIGIWMTANSTPTIAANPATLNTFSYLNTSQDPSAAQSVSISGANLTNDITVSVGAISDFEISTTENGTYNNNDITIQATNGTVTATSIWVRMKSDLTGSHSGTLTLSSAPATSVTIPLSGEVIVPMTVAEAITAIDNSTATNHNVPDAYVTGIISNVGSFSSNSITYYISSDGTTTSTQLEVYKGKGLNGANFTGADDLGVGDQVVVHGTLTYYDNTTYEFSAGSEIVSLTPHQAQSYGLTVNALSNVEMFVYDATDLTNELIEGGDAAQTVQVVEGTSIVVNLSAESGYALATFFVDGVDHLADIDPTTDTYTFEMPSHDVIITATAQRIYTISFYVNGTVDSNLEMTASSTLGTLPTPAAASVPTGFQFCGWMVKPTNDYYNASTAPTMVNASTAVSANMDLAAVFAIAETAGSSGWTLSNTAPENGDEVILATLDNATYYAFFANGSSASATAMTVVNDVITSAPETVWTASDGSANQSQVNYTGIGFSRDGVTGYLHFNNSAIKVAGGYGNGLFDFTSIQGTPDAFTMFGKMNGRYLTYNGSFGVSENVEDACPVYVFKYVAGNTTYCDYTTLVVNHADQTTIAYPDAETFYGIHYINGYVLAGEEVTNNGKLVINENGLLDMYGHDLNNNTAANLIIKDGAQLYTSNAVNGTIQKNITGYGDNDGGYYLVTAPATTVIGSNFYTTLNGDVDIYLFDQNEENFEWRNFKQATSAWNIGPACAMLYANKNDITLSFNGNWTNYVNSNPVEQHAQLPATNADINVPLEYTANKNFSGVNLIGNPFPCNATVNCSFYKMNDAGSALVPATDGEVIAPCTGIIVEATGMSQNATFSMSTSTATVMRGTLNMNLTNQQNKVDKAIVSFNEGSELGKISLLESNATISFSMDGKDYAVVSSDATGELPLNFKASRNGEYTLSFDTENVEMGYLHLIDNLTGTDVDLLANPSYTFEGKKSDYASRFRLLFKATSINDIDTEMNDDFAFISDGNIIILNEGEATLQVIDIMGRVISTQTVNGNASVNNVGAAGVYVLQLINGNNVKTQKIVVR